MRKKNNNNKNERLAVSSGERIFPNIQFFRFRKSPWAEKRSIGMVIRSFRLRYKTENISTFVEVVLHGEGKYETVAMLRFWD